MFDVKTRSFRIREIPDFRNVEILCLRMEGRVPVLGKKERVKKLKIFFLVTHVKCISSVEQVMRSP